MGLFFRQDTHIGLDIGETGVKIVQIKKNRHAYELAHAEIIPLPQGAIDNDVIQDFRLVAQVIKKAVADGGLPSRVITAVRGQNVFIRHLTLPVMPPAELAEAVKYEAENLLPLPLQEVTFDFTRIAEVNEDGIKKEEVLLVAARRNSINQLVDLLREAGLEALAIDVEPLAMIRSAIVLGKNYMSHNGKADVFAMVNISSANTLVTIVQNNVIRFTRVCPNSGSRESMITDIRRSLDFFRAQHHLDIERVCLAGSGAMTPDMGSFISDRLGIETIRFNPFKLMDTGPYDYRSGLAQSGMAMAVAVGLAIKEVN